MIGPIRARALTLLKQMLEIYSPSGQEKNLAHFLKDRFKDFGFNKVRLDKVGNVYGVVGEGRPKILLCGHMDTVPGQLPVKMEENKIFGRGAVDAKSSLSSMIMATTKLRSQEIRGSVMVVGVVDEEGKGRGIRQIIRDKLDVDYAIFGEPSGVNNITRGYKGKIDVEILCETEPGHTSAPHLFDNAIETAYRLWSKINSSSSEKRKSSRSMYYSITVCLTSMCGGGLSGVIPSRCTLDVEVRMPPSSSCQKNIDWLNGIIQQYKLENPKVRIKMRVKDKVEPFIAKKDSPLILALTQAIKDTIGGQVRLLRKTGTGDMNLFAKMKVPVITYGPGDSHLSHTLNEYVDINDYLTSIEIYRKTVELLFSKKPLR